MKQLCIPAWNLKLKNEINIYGPQTQYRKITSDPVIAYHRTRAYVKVK